MILYTIELLRCMNLFKCSFLLLLGVGKCAAVAFLCL